MFFFSKILCLCLLFRLFSFVEHSLSLVKEFSLLEILSFATSHYATCMQLVVICNYLGHVYNYKFGMYNFSTIWLCVQLNVHNMDTCHKNNGLNLYIFKLLYLIYLHRLCIIILCAFSTKVNPMLT
jgi:hypothetical protein